MPEQRPARCRDPGPPASGARLRRQLRAGGLGRGGRRQLRRHGVGGGQALRQVVRAPLRCAAALRRARDRLQRPARRV